MSLGTKPSFTQFADVILARLYATEQRDGSGFVDLGSLTQDLTGIPQFEWTFDAAKVLEARGLIRGLFTFGNVFAELTGEGRMYVEEDRGSLKGLKESNSPVLIVSVGGSGNQVAVGAGNVSQAVTIEQERKTAFSLIDRIQKGIEADATLTTAERQDFLADIDAIRGQLRKREPNRPALAALLESLSHVGSIAGLLGELIKIVNG
ncbi:MAG: hypothetical protein HYV07_03875 [Deltaproteobacteria bacterium]|nr:hypothetical protein [Deltaproteobacteria bacterium]